jgi:hypothetical protein
LKISKKILITFVRLKKGPVAEWLGRALQKLPQRFESARDLVITLKPALVAGFFLVVSEPFWTAWDLFFFLMLGASVFQKVE